MRVLQVMECTIGGTRRHLRDLVFGLAGRGVEVEVACAARREPRMRDDMAAMARAGVAVTEIPMVRAIRPVTDARHALRLAALLFDRRFDVVHTHSSKAGALGRTAALLTTSAARVHTPHTFAFAFEGGAGQGGEPAGPRGLIAATERLLGRVTRRMIHVSRGELEEGQRFGVVARARARVVHNGIDPAPFRSPEGGPELRAELGIPAGAPLVGTVGLLNDAKGHDLLIEALTHLGPEVHGLIVGSGEREADLRALAGRRGLGDRVHLPGWRDGLAPVHDALDVFVLSSRWEGMAYSLLEAMAAGCACVSTRVNGSDALLDGDPPAGVLVPRGDPPALAAAIGGLLDDRDRAAQLGRLAAERVERQFTVDHMIDGTLAVYREALGET